MNRDLYFSGIARRFDEVIARAGSDAISPALQMALLWRVAGSTFGIDYDIASVV